MDIFFFAFKNIFLKELYVLYEYFLNNHKGRTLYNVIIFFLKLSKEQLKNKNYMSVAIFAFISKQIILLPSSLSKSHMFFLLCKN